VLALVVVTAIRRHRHTDAGYGYTVRLEIGSADGPRSDQDCDRAYHGDSREVTENVQADSGDLCHEKMVVQRICQYRLALAVVGMVPANVSVDDYRFERDDPRLGCPWVVAGEKFRDLA
jgi:hypothetical protein